MWAKVGRVVLTPTTVWIWVGLVGFCGVVLFLFGLLARAQRHREDRAAGRPSKQDVMELETTAAVVFEEAQQAALDTARAEAELARAEGEREQAWQEHTALNEALQRASTELEELPTETTLPDPEQREVSRAARDAYRRGELTVEELRAVWHRLDGWNQYFEDKTHELSRLRAEISEAWRRYHVASLGERHARQAVEQAQAVERRLREQAADTAREAQLAQAQLRASRAA